MTDLPSNKIPLALAADNFATICEAIDNGNLNETIDALFSEARLELTAAVDRRVLFLQFISGNIEKAEKVRDAWKTRVEQLKHVEKRVKDKTIDVMQAQQTVQYNGEIGKLCLQANPPALELKIPVGSKSFNNILDGKYIADIPNEYLKTISFVQLDTAALKRDLDEGVEVPFAELKRGTHLRIRE